MIQRSVVWQADVEKAGVFLRNKLVHVVGRRTHKEQVVRLEAHQLALLSLNPCFGLKNLMVLIIDKIVVLELLVNFVVCTITQIAEDETEKDRHVGMIVEGHSRTLFDEEEDKTVILAVKAVNCHSIQIALEVIWAITSAVDAHLLRRHRLHTSDHVLAARIRYSAV